MSLTQQITVVHPCPIQRHPEEEQKKIETKVSWTLISTVADKTEKRSRISPLSQLRHAQTQEEGPTQDPPIGKLFHTSTPPKVTYLSPYDHTRIRKVFYLMGYEVDDERTKCVAPPDWSRIPGAPIVYVYLQKRGGIKDRQMQKKI